MGTPSRVSLLFVVLATGCTGGRRTGGGDPVGGGGGELAGIWDVVGTQGERAGDIEIGEGYFRASFGDAHRSQLIFTEEGGTATTHWSYTRRGSPITIATEHAARAADYGELPLALGGTWRWSHGTNWCDATVEDGAATANCDADFGWTPWPLPKGAYHTGKAVRTSRASSIFGELGGTWVVSYDGVERCTATFAGRSFTCDCPRATSGWIHGYVEVHFSGDVASGLTGDGLDFSAIRR